MFNFMKKKPTKTETPEQQAERDSAVDKVLLGYEIGTVSIATMVTGLERDGEALLLHQRTWPYPEVALENSTACAMDVELIRELSAMTTELTECAVRGDSCCTFRLLPESTASPPV